MDDINIRYGEDVTLPIDANDVTATTATLYIGNPGETPKITQEISLVGGNGTFELSGTQTSIPIGCYKYQVNIVNDLGQVEKYPDPDDCDDCTDEDNFPSFTVHEALDVTELVS